MLQKILTKNSFMLQKGCLYLLLHLQQLPDPLASSSSGYQGLSAHRYSAQSIPGHLNLNLTLKLKCMGFLLSPFSQTCSSHHPYYYYDRKIFHTFVKILTQKFCIFHFISPVTQSKLWCKIFETCTGINQPNYISKPATSQVIVKLLPPFQCFSVTVKCQFWLMFSHKDLICSVLNNLMPGQPEHCWMLWGREKYFPYSETSPEP